jgi:hypothetical protein
MARDRTSSLPTSLRKHLIFPDPIEGGQALNPIFAPSSPNDLNGPSPVPIQWQPEHRRRYLTHDVRSICERTAWNQSTPNLMPASQPSGRLLLPHIEAVLPKENEGGAWRRTPAHPQPRYWDERDDSPSTSHSINEGLSLLRVSNTRSEPPPHSVSRGDMRAVNQFHSLVRGELVDIV